VKASNREQLELVEESGGDGEGGERRLSMPREAIWVFEATLL